MAPILVFGFGSFEYLNGRITPGDIAALMTLLLAVVKIGMTAGIEFFEFGSVFAAARRLNETLRLPIEEDLDSSRPDLARSPSVELDRVAFRHRSTDVRALADVSMLADAGKVIALVGASGSGKSTIAELISRFFDVDAGEIRLDRKPIQSLRRLQVRRTAALVAQDPFSCNATVRDNLAFGLTDVAFVTLCMPAGSRRFTSLSRHRRMATTPQ